MRSINQTGSARKLAIPLALIGGLAMSTSSAQAGLFDFLFNPAPPQQQFEGPPPREVWPQPPQDEAPVERPRNVVTQKPTNTSLCCKNGENPRSAIMADPTLQPGDAVVTAGGISIFQGEPGVTQHAPTDFASLAQAQTLSPENRARLQALDRHQRRSQPPMSTPN